MATGRPRSAKHAAAVGIPLSAGVGVGVACLVGGLGRWIPLLFTSDPRVVSAAAAHLPLLAGLLVLDAVQEGLLGVARGCEKYALGAVINVAADLASIASAILLAFGLHWRLQGLLVGMGVGIALQTLALTYVLFTTNWSDQSVRAIRRVESRVTRVLPTTASVRGS